MQRSPLIPLLAAMAFAALPAAASAHDADRDDDGMRDRWEQRHHAFSPRADLDHDGLRNLAEFRRHTNPRDADTDDDHIRDGRERRFGLDATRRDTDRDGVRDDDENAGRIASFSNGVLTIDLVTGGQLSGRVTPGTEIKCEEGPRTTATSSRHDGDDDDDDRSGRRGGDDDDHSGPGRGGDDRRCGTAELTTGRIVEEAELDVTSAGGVFDEVELR